MYASVRLAHKTVSLYLFMAFCAISAPGSISLPAVSSIAPCWLLTMSLRLGLCGVKASCRSKVTLEVCVECLITGH